MPVRALVDGLEFHLPGVVLPAATTGEDGDNILAECCESRVFLIELVPEAQ